MRKKAAYAVPVLLGILFCFYYLYTAVDNVVYSDYIRLINAYLPDVGNPAKFFVPDILTRVPITYLGRLINVNLFGYHTVFDAALGVAGLGVGAAALANYGQREEKLPYLWFIFALIIYFGLNKWEMLTNGTGWVCFLSISGFYCHYLILDHAIQNSHSSKRDRVVLMVLPSVLTLLVAGPYCGGYSALLFLVYVVMIGADFMKCRRINRLYAGYLAAVLIPLLLYLWSNSAAVYVHRGAVGGSIVETFFSNPIFFVKFLLKALASAVIGYNQLNALETGAAAVNGNLAVCALGFAVMGLYLYALFLTWRYKLYTKTVFPLLLILSGGLNHLLILSARWIFLKDTYGMSSRYAIQYQMGLVGILFTFAIVRSMRRQPGKRSPFTRTAIAIGAAVMLAGSLFTTMDEMKTAPFRKDFLKISREVGLNYQTASDQDLETYLQHDPDEVRKAMEILEENNLNIFRGK